MPSDIEKTVEIYFQLKDQTTAQAKRIADSLIQVDKAVTVTDKAMKKLESTMSSITSFRKLKKETVDLNKAWKDAETRVAKLARAMKESGGATEKQNIAFKKAVSNARTLKKAYQGSAAQLNKLRKSLSATGVNTKKLSTETVRLNKAMQRLKKSTQQVAVVAPIAGKKMKTAFQGLDSMLMGVSTSLAIIGAALLGPFALGIKRASDFEDAMLAVKGISGATADEFTRLTKIALKMGRETRYTAIEAAEGLRFMSMAGLSATQQIAALPSVLQLAQAGALDLGRAADIATNIMTGFGFAAEDLVAVNDILVKAFTSSNSSLEELATSLVYVGPLAKGLGANFEELVATLGNMHNAGIKGSMAGTSLRNVLDTLFNPTKDEAEQMAELSARIGGVGLQIKDSKGQFVGFIKIMQQLEAANITAQEALKLFGQRAGPGVAALLLQGSGALQDMTDKMNTADGTAQHIAETMESGLGGAMRRLKSAVDGLLTSLGNNFIDSLSVLINGLSAAVIAVTEFREALGPLTVALDLVIGSIAVLGVAAGVSGLAYGLILAPLIKGVKAMAMAKKETVTLSIALKVLGKRVAAVAFRIAAFFASSPIGWFIIATGAVLAMAAAHKTEREQLQKSLDMRDVAMIKQKEQARSLGELVNALKELDEGTENHAAKAKKLRDSFVKAGDGITRLADAAKEAAESIDEVTGAILDGGEAIQTFEAIALISELQDLGTKGVLLGQILQKTGELGKMSFAELAAASKKFKDDGLGPLDKESNKLFENMVLNADTAINKLREMELIDFDSTKKEVAEVAESYLDIGENAGLAKDAVIVAFDKMTMKAQKKTDSLAKAIQESFKKPIKEGLRDTEQVLQEGIQEIAGYYRDFHGDLHSNAEIFGEDYVQVYNVMFQNLEASQRKGFLEYFRTHQYQAKTLYDSSLDETEKLRLLEESKVRFILQIEKRFNAELARERVGAYDDRIELIRRETASKILLIQESASREKKTLDQVKQEVLAAEIESHVRLLEEAKKYVNDVAEVFGTEDKAYKKAVKKQMKAATALKDFKIKAAQETADAIISEIEKAADAEQRAKDKIKGYENDIFDLKLGLSDKLRALRRKDFEVERADRDRQIQANERLAAARIAYGAGDIERAQKLAAQASGFYTGLKETQKVQAGIKKTVAFQIILLKELALIEANKAAAASKSQNDLKLTLKDVTKIQNEIADKFTEIYKKQKDPFNITVLLDDADAKNKIKALMAPTFSEHTVTVKVVKPKIATPIPEGDAAGGVAGMSGGGRLSGYGTKDVIPALLTLGERILNSTSTRILDNVFPGMMESANKVKTSGQARDWMSKNALREFAAGALVGYQPSTTAPSVSGSSGAMGNLGKLELVIGGSTFPVLAQPNVAKELEITLKREALLRSN